MENNFNTNIGTSHETTHTLDFSERLYKVALGFVAVVGVLGAAWVFAQFSGLPHNAPHEISVSGEGKAYAKPDIAIISFGAHTEAPKSQDAVNKNNTIMEAVTKAVKDLGVEDKDIQTTLYNLSPVYGTEVLPMGAAPTKGAVALPERSMVYPYPVPNNKVVGYALDQQIQVKIRNFDNINAILDAATTNGANTVGSLYFTVDDMEKFKAEARQKAIAQAKEKAGSMFKEAGLTGQKLVNISEGYGYPAPMYGLGSALEKAADAASPNIQTGQMEINTTVTLTYRVK
jgi:uncharacterized protein YggE